MISFDFSLSNPWRDQFDHLWSKVYNTPIKHKCVEVEFNRDNTLVAFALNWTIRKDHGGLIIGAGLFGYCLHFIFYDNRHWNSDEGRYEEYADDSTELLASRAREDSF